MVIDQRQILIIQVKIVEGTVFYGFPYVMIQNSYNICQIYLLTC